MTSDECVVFGFFICWIVDCGLWIVDWFEELSNGGSTAVRRSVRSVVRNGCAVPLLARRLSALALPLSACFSANAFASSSIPRPTEKPAWNAFESLSEISPSRHPRCHPRKYSNRSGSLRSFMYAPLNVSMFRRKFQILSNEKSLLVLSVGFGAIAYPALLAQATQNQKALCGNASTSSVFRPGSTAWVCSHQFTRSPAGWQAVTSPPANTPAPDATRARSAGPQRPPERPPGLQRRGCRPSPRRWLQWPNGERGAGGGSFFALVDFNALCILAPGECALLLAIALVLVRGVVRAVHAGFVALVAFDAAHLAPHQTARISKANASTVQAGARGWRSDVDMANTIGGRLGGLGAEGVFVRIANRLQTVVFALAHAPTREAS